MSATYPTPWTFSADNEFEDTPIRDANGEYVLIRDSGVYPPDLDTCREIVEAVNNYEVLIQERRRLIGELDAAKVHADSEERWANEYFAQAQKAEAERDRLRDIMRGLVAILETITLEDHEIALLDEAREAVKEKKP